MKIFFPDCLWNPNKISGSSFLYFHDEKIYFSLAPSVSTFLSGVVPFSFLKLIENESPPWKDAFLTFFNMWYKFKTSLIETNNIIEPLRDSNFKMIQFSYDRGKHAFNNAEEIIQSTQLKLSEIYNLIDPYHACDELFSHLFFEKVLEMRYDNMTNEEYAEFQKQQASAKISEDFIKYFNWKPLYDYCNELFNRNTLEELLVKSYMFRFNYLHDMPSILLSNSNLIFFLGSMPVSYNKENKVDENLELDVIAWELFRHLVSPKVDPLEHKKVSLVKKMLNLRVEEIERLKNRCYTLSTNLSQEKNLDRLTLRVRDIIKAEVANDLQELLKIDDKAFQSFFSELLSDKKMWMTILTIIHGLRTGGEVITAGASLYGLSKIGATIFKELSERNKTLSTSAYTLIYRMS